MGKGFDSKCDFIPATALLGLLLCPCTWVIFFGGIQHFPLNGCSIVSCNFGVLAANECTSFYSAILHMSFTLYIYISEKAMAPRSSTLAWKIPWMEKPGRLQSMGSLRVGHD